MYSGDRLDRIYQLLEDNPVTRWLPTICDDSYNDHELWSKLIEFLEKELTVQQQKLLMQGKSDKKRSRSHPDQNPLCRCSQIRFMSEMLCDVPTFKLKYLLAKHFLETCNIT